MMALDASTAVKLSGDGNRAPPSIYRKFKNSFPGALRPESGVVGRGALKGASRPCALMPPWDDLRRVRSLPQCAGRATRRGGVKSLEADGLRRPLEAFSRAGSKSVQIGEDRGSARSEGCVKRIPLEA